jgi:DNA-binding HxlR family transcriptional regulator
MKKKRPDAVPSTCPINASLLVLGDRWALLIVRDLMFADCHGFKQFLSTGERMATNILTDRLERLLQAGIIKKEPDPSDGRKWVYGLTSKGVELAPILLELSKWGAKYEQGIAPKGVLEAWSLDREGFLTDLHKTLAVDP